MDPRLRLTARAPPFVRPDPPLVAIGFLLVVEGPKPPPVAGGRPTMNREIHPQVCASVGGVLYLLIIALGIVQEAFIRGRITAGGDAAATFAICGKAKR